MQFLTDEEQAMSLRQSVACERRCGLVLAIVTLLLFTWFMHNVVMRYGV